MDISMCFGNNCPIKNNCLRFKNKYDLKTTESVFSNPYVWITDFKGQYIDGKFICERYIIVDENEKK
jgi:hypothetical protein